MSVFIFLYSKNDPISSKINQKIKNSETTLSIRSISIDNYDIRNLIDTSTEIKINYIPFLIEILEDNTFQLYEGELQCLGKIFPVNKEIPQIVEEQSIKQTENKKSIHEIAAQLQELREKNNSLV